VRDWNVPDAAPHFHAWVPRPKFQGLLLFHHNREGSFGAESQEIFNQMAKIDFPFKGPVETNAGVPKFWKTLTQAFVDRQTHSPFLTWWYG
jgi:hypothetical protein